MLRMIREEILPYVHGGLSEMSRSDLMKMKKYVFCFATAKEIRETARNDFYGLVERIEEVLESLSESVESEDSEDELQVEEKMEEDESGNKEVIIGQKEVILGQNWKEGPLNLMAEILEEENLAEMLKKGKDSESSESELSEESAEVNPAQVNEHLPRSFRNFLEANQTAVAQVGEVLGIEKEEDENVADFDAEYGDMGYEELRARLPPYFMMSKKKKRTYFLNLTKEFIRKVQPRKSGMRMKKVNFNIKENQVVTFFKDAKIKK